MPQYTSLLTLLSPAGGPDDPLQAGRLHRSDGRGLQELPGPGGEDPRLPPHVRGPGGQDRGAGGQQDRPREEQGHQAPGGEAGRHSLQHQVHRDIAGYVIQDHSTGL